MAKGYPVYLNQEGCTYSAQRPLVCTNPLGHFANIFLTWMIPTPTLPYIWHNLIIWSETCFVTNFKMKSLCNSCDNTARITCRGQICFYMNSMKGFPYYLMSFWIAMTPQYSNVKLSEPVMKLKPCWKLGLTNYGGSLLMSLCKRYFTQNFVMKNGVFWDVRPCGSSKNRRFGGT
jgi:hypothetical protein